MSDSERSPRPRQLTFAAPRGLYFLIFAISGFAGLIYESIWSHYLKLFLGHAAYAQSLVLIIFMAGMALGAWIASRLSPRWRSLLIAYAAVELVVGLAALLFHPLFAGLMESFYATVLPATGDPLIGNLLKFAAASLIILPQSILLGTTFPLMSAGIIRRFPDTPGGSIAMLYFTNSIGAAIGVLASSFWLIGKVGLPGTIGAAGLLNILLALAVFVLVRLDPESPAIPQQPRAGRGELSVLSRRFLFAAFITGAASFIYEIGWIRMLSLVLGSTTHSFELMLSAFITGLAFGGLWIKRRIDSIDRPVRFSGYVQLIMGAFALLTLPVYAQTFDWMAWLLQALELNEENYTTFTVASHGIALAVMLPTTFMAGMTLPLFTHVLMKRGEGERSIGRVYAANTIGAICGVLFAVHVGLPMLGLKWLIVTGALLDIALGIFLLDRAEPSPTKKREKVRYGLTCGAVLVVIAGVVDLDQRLLASGVYRMGSTDALADSDVSYHRDGKTATITLSQQPGGFLSLLTNGKSDASIQVDPGNPYARDEITMTLLGSLAFAYQPDAKRVAVIGLGSGMTTHTVLAKSDVEVVDTIEIESFVVDAAKGYGAVVERAFDDPRSMIHIEDAKTFFSLHNRKYEIISAEPSNPWVSGVASLFSAEFYDNVTSHLTDGGVFMQWIQLYEFNDELTVSILKAMQQVFSDFVIYRADDGNVLLIAKNGGELGEARWEALFSSGLGDTLRRVDIRSDQDLLIRKVATAANITPLLKFYAAPANSDYFPYVDLQAGKARFASAVSMLFTNLSHSSLPILEMLNGDRLEFAQMQRTPFLQRYTSIDFAERVHRRLVTGASLQAVQADGVMVPDGVWSALEALASGQEMCPSQDDADRWLNALHAVVRPSLSDLGHDDAAALVESVAGTDCDTMAAAPISGWLALYRAVAIRDAAAMSAAATDLLRGGNGIAGSAVYLVSAAMLADIARGRPAQAFGIWEEFVSSEASHENLPDDLRLLLAIAYDATRSP